MSREVQEQAETVQTLVKLGKEQGYLLYDQVNDILASEEFTAEQIDGLFSVFEGEGISFFEDASDAKAALPVPETAEQAGVLGQDEEARREESEVEQIASPGEKTSDPVRVYLREMGVVPLLTRESEVVIAKRLERGNIRVLKTVSRSAIVVKELIGVGADLRSGHRSIKDIVQIDEEELTAEKVEEKTRQTLRIIDKIEKLHALAQKQASKLENTGVSNRRAYLRAKRRVLRTRIAISLLSPLAGVQGAREKATDWNFAPRRRALAYSGARGCKIGTPRQGISRRCIDGSAQGTAILPWTPERN